MADNDQPPVVIVRSRQRQPIPRYVWLLVLVIIIFFAIGAFMFASGITRPDPENIPRTPDYALTPGQ